jgi:hypothetical protein
MKKKPSIASKKLSHGQQKTQQSRLTLTIFPPLKTQALTEKHVQLDLNNARVSGPADSDGVLNQMKLNALGQTFKKILKLTWPELATNDKGLHREKFKALLAHKAINPLYLVSRLNPPGVIGSRQGNRLCVLLVSAES